ncbi:hypothetical protein FRC12_000109 [Ceratobasidium sp. 428]|nr:hypothetical protein FRC12_000109 [Ceratobasidium sp. 428]
MAPRLTSVYAGYFVSKEELDQWSKREAEVNLAYKRCLRQEAGFVGFAIDAHLSNKLGVDLVKRQYMPKPEHGGCGRQCSNLNMVFYRRYAETNSLANCKPAVWKRFEEKSADVEVKRKLEETLHLELSDWTTIVWAPTAMIYNLVPEEFEESKAEIIERIERGPPGPCGGDPPPLP